MIDRLWKGETITQDGRFAPRLKLHTLADQRPPIWVSAFARRPPRSRAAAVTGGGRSRPESTPEVIEAYRDAGGDGEIVFQVLVSWAPSDEEAVEQARKWKGAQPQDHFTADWHEPRKMYEHGEQEMSDEEFAGQHRRGFRPGGDPGAAARARAARRDRAGAPEQLGLQRRARHRGARPRRAAGATRRAGLTRGA